MLKSKSLLFLPLLLLLLAGYSGSAKAAGNTGVSKRQPIQSLNKAGLVFQDAMLQPQVVHINAAPEHLVKQLNPGFGIFPFRNTSIPLLQPLAQKKMILQDADRCESVSRLLFPYHIFW